MPTLDPGGDYLTRVWRDHVYPLAQKMEMPLRMPPVQPRSRRAHEAAKWADSLDCFDEYNTALFRAFFQFGLDIGKIGILEQLAADLHLDQAALLKALETNHFTGDVLQDQEDARRIGVNAVPAFALSEHVIASGVQSAARLRELIGRRSS